MQFSVNWLVKKIAFNPFLYVVKDWCVPYGNLGFNNSIIWSPIDLKFGRKVRFYTKSWCKKDLWERTFYTKVMIKKTVVFVVKGLFWKLYHQKKVQKYGNKYSESRQASQRVPLHQAMCPVLNKEAPSAISDRVLNKYLMFSKFRQWWGWSLVLNI